MSDAEVAGLVISAITGVLVPIALLIVGNRFTQQKERADAAQRQQQERSEQAQRTATQIAQLMQFLSSENTSQRLLALQILRYLRSQGQFPAELVSTLTAITFRDNPEVAGAALLVLDGSAEPTDDIRLLELFAPLKVHFERTLAAFGGWLKARDEATERLIKQNNEYARDLLLSRAYLIPEDLRPDASNLIDHYNAWLAEFERVYPNNIRDPNVPFVFVGTKGMPFPRASEQRFLAKYEELRAGTRVKAEMTSVG